MHYICECIECKATWASGLDRTMYTHYSVGARSQNQVNPMQEQKTERIDIRTSFTAKAVLQQAASSVNKTVSEFLLDTGLSAASEVLADRRVFALNDEQWDQFQEVLDADPKDKPALKKLLSDRSVFD